MNLIKKTALAVIAFAFMGTSALAVCDADINMGGNKITNFGTPTASTDAVNKAYLVGDSAWTDVELGGSFSGMVKFRKVAPGFTCVALTDVITSSAYGEGAALLTGSLLPIPNYTVHDLLPASTGGGLGWITLSYGGNIEARALDHRLEVGRMYSGNFCYSSEL